MIQAVEEVETKRTSVVKINEDFKGQLDEEIKVDCQNPHTEEIKTSLFASTDVRLRQGKIFNQKEQVSVQPRVIKKEVFFLQR